MKIDLRRLNPLSSISSPESAGVDLSTNTLKISHVKTSSNKPEIISLISRNIGGLDEDNISKAVRSALGELRLKAPLVINTVPTHSVITKNIEIPSTDPKEIKEIINLQAGRHTPYSREEIIVDYVEIGTYKNNYTKILLVIVARNIVERQLKILEKAGLKLENVIFVPEALAWYISKIQRMENDSSPVNLIHLDEEFTDFTVVFRSKIIFVRCIPIGARHLKEEKEKYQVKFSEELKRSFEAYQSEDIEKNPNMLVLTGAVEELNDLESVLNSTLHLPVKVIPPFTNLSVSNDILKMPSSAKRLSFLSVIAPVLAHQVLKVNLIPEEIKLKRSLEERGRDLIKTGIFILTIFIIIVAILASKIYFKNSYLKILNRNYESLNKDARKLEEDFAKVNLIKGYLSRRGYSLEILAELYDMMSLELKINSIRLDEQGRFSLAGTAESMSAVFSFVGNMEKSKYFKDVKTKYTTKRKEEARDVTDFELTAMIDNKVNKK